MVVSFTINNHNDKKGKHKYNAIKGYIPLNNNIHMVIMYQN